jgi:legumain
MELVFYLEACESGSMFQNLPKDIKIFATSAASPDESSWGTYCSPDDKVGGKAIGSCLGDLYSVNWMEDSDAADLNTETL